MFYRVEITDHIRVSPRLFNKKIEDAVAECISKKYEGYISQELGFIIDVCNVTNITQGIIIPGDGATYYEATFELMIFKPELQEIVVGRIKDIADFGAFITLGPTDGMIHVSQTMDDFVSFSKEKVLVGRESKRSLKVGDECRARIIAVSFKDITNPKIGLTMRQSGLGKKDWAQEVAAQASAETKEKETPKKGKKKE